MPSCGRILCAMNLFRATSARPEFATPELEAELAALEAEKSAGPPGEFMVDAFQRMGREKYARYVELRQVVQNNQFFTDSEVQARYMAGNHRFLIKLQVPDEVAAGMRVTPEEVGAVGERAFEGSGNYAVSGRELAARKDEWKLEVRELE